jgi:hypothetical protein
MVKFDHFGMTTIKQTMFALEAYRKASCGRDLYIEGGSSRLLHEVPPFLPER